MNQNLLNKCGIGLFISPLIGSYCLGSDYEEKEKNHVIYICIEDMSPKLGCYGDETVYSPNIDAFARDAVLFEDVNCQVALSTPSRTSILTGIRPSTSGIVKIDDDWQKILPEATSLPRHFKNNGYHTILAGKIHDYRCGGMDNAYHSVYDIHGLDDNKLALKAINEAEKQYKPVFLAIGYSHVHEPWDPNQWSKNQYQAAEFSSKGRSHQYKGKNLSDFEVQQFLRNYYAEITEVDSLIGDVFDRLKENGLYNNSIILLGSMDHGFSLGWHDHWGKGNNVDTETQVPLMVRIPGNPANGKRCPEIIELVDIYPTLIDLCGLTDTPQKLEGVSFQPLLRNPEKPWKKAAFTHRAYHINDIGIKTKNYTLILRQGQPPHLYDRKKDPLNLHNIAPENPDIVKKLKQIKQKGWSGIAVN
jgi:arylsulfatase A-like enzyme